MKVPHGFFGGLVAAGFFGVVGLCFGLVGGVGLRGLAVGAAVFVSAAADEGMGSDGEVGVKVTWCSMAVPAVTLMSNSVVS